MTICLIGNGIYTIDPCTATITSDGSPGIQKFNFPITNFRVYVLKKESGCGSIPSNVAILYYKPPDYAGDWTELTRVNSSLGEGSAWVWFDITNPGDKFWKIVWGDCVKEFVSGDPASLRLAGSSWIIGDGWSANLCMGGRFLYGKGDAILIEGGIQASTTGMYDTYGKTYYTCMELTKEILITGSILKFRHSSTSGFSITIYRPYSGINAISVGISGDGEKEVDISRFGSGSITFIAKLSKDSPTPFSETFSVGNITMCNPDWQCEQPLNGYESDISGCISGVLDLEKRRANSNCNPCIPIWRCKIPYDGTEIDSCGNSRLNPNCTAENIGNGIINGGFDYNLDGWTAIKDCTRYWFTHEDICVKWPGWVASDISWDNGRARLRVLRCADAYLEQSFTITGSPISFDSEQITEGWGESPGYELSIDGSIVKTEGLGTGTKIIDVVQYIGRQTTLRFYIRYSGPCYMNDHGNTYLWVDNVKVPCQRTWRCEQPLNGYEFNDCNERRPNLVCSSCVPEWKCEEGQIGYEVDGCGNRRENIKCIYREAELISCKLSSNIIYGEETLFIVTINQGSKTENYKLVFSGDLMGETDMFLINAGSGQIQTTFFISFDVIGPKSITATLVKV